MTTYIDGKAVGVGTIRAEIGVSGNVLHDSTLKGNGNTEPLGVDTEVIATTNQVGNLATTLNTAIDAQAEAIQKTREDFIEADSEIHQMINGLSAETTTIKNNQASLGTQVANIEHKIPDGTTGTNPLINKQILAQTSYTKAEVDAKVSSVYKFKGSVSTYNSLPSTATTGDVYNVADTGANYAWDGSKWDKLSETVDLSSYATTAYVNAREQDIRDDYMAADADLQTQINGQATAIAGKQDKLTAGDNIIISGNVISATGGAGGDYLPLSGGTLTGLLTLTAEKTDYSFQSGQVLKIITESEDGGKKEISIFANGVSIGFNSLKLVGLSGLNPSVNESYDIGDSFVKWRTVYTTKLNNGEDIAVPTTGGTLARIEDLQNETTALNTAIAGKQDKLTAGENITIEDGVISATGGGASLPDQTDNAGKFLTTDGTTASWGEALTNKSENGFAVGENSSATVWGGLAIGKSCESSGIGSVAIGSYAFGNTTRVHANRAVQIGWGENSDDDTFKVSNTNGNFEIMDANGNVPLDRLTYVTDQIGDISTALTAILGE